METTTLDSAEPMAQDPKVIAARHGFGRAHRDWLIAKAAITGPDLPDDESMNALLRRHAEAERALLLIPASVPEDVWIKLNVLDDIVTDEVVSGERYDRLAIVALGAIKADLLVLGFGGITI